MDRSPTAFTNRSASTHLPRRLPRFPSAERRAAMDPTGIVFRALVSIADQRQAAQVRAALVRHGALVMDHARGGQFERDRPVHVLVAELHPIAIELARTLRRSSGT